MCVYPECERLVDEIFNSLIYSKYFSEECNKIRVENNLRYQNSL